MTTEPLPDDCLPPPDVLAAALKLARDGWTLDDQSRIVGGLFHGWTPAEVAADRERFRRMTGG